MCQYVGRANLLALIFITSVIIEPIGKSVNGHSLLGGGLGMKSHRRAVSTTIIAVVVVIVVVVAAIGYWAFHNRSIHLSLLRFIHH